MFDNRLEIHSPGKLPNIVTVENIRHERFSRNPRIARTLTEFGWVREMNEGVKRIYSEMESAFLHEPCYSEPGNKVVLTLENSITSRTLRTRDLSVDEKLLIQYMYNTAEPMTTKKVAEFLGRSVSYSSKLLKTKGILTWYGTSTKDRSQYYKLEMK